MDDGRESETSSEDGSDWRFLIDENLSPAITTELEHAGIEAEYVLDALFEGADDFEDILPYCHETGAVLVTNNVLDFNRTDLVPEDHSGIVIVHDQTRPPAEIASELQEIVAAYPSQDALEGFESADDWSSDGT
jgi:predicted nuclease of predicted toxin-antitoxin system